MKRSILNPISVSLLRRIFFCYFLVAIAMTCFHLVMEYRATESRVRESLGWIAKSFNDTLSHAMWNYDEKSTEATLRGMLKMAGVAGIKIPSYQSGLSSAIGLVEDQGQVMERYEVNQKEVEKGEGLTSMSSFELISHEFEIWYITGERKEFLGVGVIYSSVHEILAEVKTSFFIILINALVKTAALWLIMIYFIRKLVAKPLKTLISNAERLDPEKDDFSFDSTVMADSGLLKKRDEIGVLAWTLESMRSKLQMRDIRLKEYSTDLESKVKQRTTQLDQQLVKNVNLVRVLCHDISNHILVVSSNIALLNRDRFTTEKSEKYVKKSENNTRMIKDILDHVRQLQAIESGKIKLSLTSVDLVPLINQVKETFEDKLNDKDIDIVLEGCDAPVNVLADEVSLRSNILNNLVSNAIKFNPIGQSIFIRLQSVDGKVLISIRDKGMGIPDDLIPKLFDRSEETSRAGTKGEKGTGFGLPIVHMFTQYNNGKVEVKSSTSEEDHGTEFIVTLSAA